MIRGVRLPAPPARVEQTPAPAPEGIGTLDAFLWLKANEAMLWFLGPGRVVVAHRTHRGWVAVEKPTMLEAVREARAGMGRVVAPLSRLPAPDGAPGGRDLEALLRESVTIAAAKKTSEMPRVTVPGVPDVSGPSTESPSRV